MTTARKQAVKTFITAIAAVLYTQMSSAAGMADPEPIVVWDGAKTDYKFTTLTKKIDDNTYTLNLNEMNSVAADGSYVQIGSENAKAAITITAVNDDTSITNAFGTDGAVTVIMKYTDLPVSAGANRALISLLDSQKYKSGNVGTDNSVKIGVSDFAGTGYFSWQGGYYSSFAGANFVATEQTAALTYSSTDGTAFYLDGVGISTHTGVKSATYTTPCGIALGGVDTDDSTQFYAMTGMKIKAVAIFTSTLTAEQIANYKFPSRAPISASLVSEINDIFGLEDEIDVIVADGATITGDTTFNASTVRFHCDGSFEFIPPAGNTAVLDFSDVTGGPVLKYTGFFPAVSGTTFTSNSIPTSVSDASSWKGTVWVRGVTQMVNLNPDTYGNSSSTLRLSGCAGYFASGAVTCNVAIELMDDGYQYGINISNGYSRDSSTSNNRVVINKLKGSGAVWTSGSAPNVIINVRDWSEFTGPLQFVNKTLVLGENIPAFDDFNVAGSIYICAGATLTATSQLRADGGIYVNGALSTPNVSATYIRAETTIHVPDTGILEITRSDSSANNDGGTAYGNVTGTGTIKFAGEGFTVISQSIPTALTFAAEKANGSVVPAAGATIGSLTGSKGFRSDWGATGEGGRYLTIKQSKDTVWEGSINVGGEHRLTGVVVDPGASSTGTLTMTANQTATSTLAVNGSVNLTGTWVGPVTVAGTLGGTGTITGDLTLSSGATIKVNDISDSLEVSGSLTATGAITIELPEGAEKGMLIETDGKPDISGATFAVTVGGVAKNLKVSATAGGLKVGAQSLLIRIR